MARFGMLTEALAAGAESDAPSCEGGARGFPGERMALRFEALSKSSGPKTVERSIGSRCDGDHLQGVDVDLHCPVP